MRPQVRRAIAHQPFDIAVLLLKVLGAKEHALRPDDLVVPRHSFSLLASVSASPPRFGGRAVDLLRKTPPIRRPLGRSGTPERSRPLLPPSTACVLKLLDLLGIGFRERLTEDAVYVFPDLLGKLLVECAVGVPVARLAGRRQHAGEHAGGLCSAL